MSTRASIRIMDRGGDHIWFYRHCDGDPECTMPSLQKFMNWVRAGKVNDNVEDSSTWIIVLGMQDCLRERHLDIHDIGPHLGRVVSEYTIADGRPGDISYLYEIDLDGKTITGYRVGRSQNEMLFIDHAATPWKAERPEGGTS